MKFIKKALPWFSYIFHPIFISLFAVIIYFFAFKIYFEYQTFYIVFIQIVIVTILIPITFYYLLLTLGAVQTIMLEKSSQRKIPLMVHIVLLFVLIRRSITIESFPELYYFFLAAMISSILALVLIFFSKKASLHMLGITSLTVFSMALSIHFQTRFVTQIIFLLLVCGVIATSRLFMKAHTQTELFLGSLIGVLPQAAMAYFWM
jgi:hypothetical protein